MRTNIFVRCAAWLLVVCLIAACVPFPARADGTETVVRVGWYESPYNMTDRFGRRTGYAYDYQRKLAAYTGWTYEYVEGSWPELFQMLLDGEIDLLSDVSYTEARAASMLFSSYPMGTEEYYLDIAADNPDYSRGDYAYFNGKRIGVNRGSYQAELFRSWAKAHGVEAELVELTVSEAETAELVTRGELDACVRIDAYNNKDGIIPVVKIGASDYYFAVSKDRPELLNALDAAMSRIQDENRYYNQMLFEKYVGNTGANLFLDAEELDWLSEHGTIRVGYQDNYLAYCAEDPQTGELTGALKDYLESAADCMVNARLDFEPVSYPGAAAALEALRSGEVDCVFPVNFSVSDSEELGVDVTPTVTSAELYAVVRAAEQKSFSMKELVTVAVCAGDRNYETLVLDSFPDWEMARFQDAPACLRAVAEGRADCFLISSYRYNDLMKLCERYGLSTLATGAAVDYCFAVRADSRALYSILARVSGVVPDTAVSAALTRYFSEEARVGLLDFLRDNPLVVAASGAMLAALLLVIFFQSRTIRAEKRAAES